MEKIACTCDNEHVTNTGRENNIDMIGERYKDKQAYTKRSAKDIKSYLTDSTRTDTTICSMRIDYVDEAPKKCNVNVITKSNRSTATDRAKLCDVSTVTSDWWSPLVERKDMKLVRESGKSRERKSVRTSTDGRVVTFESLPRVIPSDNSYILSPSRYLLESQKYYNELFSPKFYAPHLLPAIRAGQKKKVNITASRANKNSYQRSKKILRTNERLYGRPSSRTMMRPRLHNISSSRSDDTTSIFS